MQDFSAFLYRVKSVYTYTLEESKIFKNNKDQIEYILLEVGEVDQLEKQFIDEFQQELIDANYNSKRYQLFSKDLGEDDIYIKKIDDGSFELLLSGLALGMVFVLAILVSITGGQMSVSPTKIEFEAGKTLGEGLEDLKEFLRK